MPPCAFADTAIAARPIRYFAYELPRRRRYGLLSRLARFASGAYLQAGAISAAPLRSISWLRRRYGFHVSLRHIFAAFTPLAAIEVIFDGQSAAADTLIFFAAFSFRRFQLYRRRYFSSRVGMITASLRFIFQPFREPPPSHVASLRLAAQFLLPRLLQPPRRHCRQPLRCFGQLPSRRSRFIFSRAATTRRHFQTLQLLLFIAAFATTDFQLYLRDISAISSIICREHIAYCNRFIARAADIISAALRCAAPRRRAAIFCRQPRFSRFRFSLLPLFADTGFFAGFLLHTAEIVFSFRHIEWPAFFDTHLFL
jgi:hypothetical protein